MRIYDKDVPTTADEAHMRWPGFYSNPAIQELGQYPMWTVTDPTDKKPCSFRAMIEGRTYQDKKTGELVIPGARATESDDRTTLDDLVSSLPNASNNSFWLLGAEHGYVVVDIEKTASDETRSRLLELPWVYAERSMSGTGIHLLVPYPEKLFDELENAAVKPAIKSFDNTWEVLVNHWVTFTRDVIEDVQPGNVPLDAIIRPMAEKANEPIVKITFDDLPEITPDMDAYKVQERLLRDTDGEYPKPRIDGRDQSAFDYGMAMYFLKHIRRYIDTGQYHATPEEAVAIVVDIMDGSPQARDKWYDHMVGKVPYLIYTVQKAYADTFRDKLSADADDMS